MSNRLVALPSLSNGLANLPHANSMTGVSLHYPLSPSGYSQESEDKLRRAIASQNAGRYSPASSVSSESSSSNGGDYIMMGSKRR